MKEPGPDHPIEITPESGTVRVTFNGRTVAESNRALAMRETDYPVIHYIPADDVDDSLLTPTDHSSHCPYKGDASYYTLNVDGEEAVNAVWYYPEPYPAVGQIKDHVAFYRTRVDGIEVG